MRIDRRLKSRIVAAIALAATASAAHAADISVTFALPAQSILFSPFYVAQDKGYFKDEGLNVNTTVVAGPGTMSAVLSGSAQFGSMAGAVIIAAASKNQRVDVIGLTQNEFSTEFVLSKKAVAKIGVSPDASDEKRGKALKGLTIGVDAIGGLPHAYLRFIAKKFGMDADKDMTVTPLQPPAMVSALEQGRIDGFVFSQPFTLQAVADGALMWFSGVRGDLPELAPHVYNAVIVQRGYCNKNNETCQKFMNAVNKALALIKSDPNAALKSVEKIFAKMPTDLLKESFNASAKLAQSKATITAKAVENTISFTKTSGIIPTNAKLPPASELYENEFNK